MKKDSKKTKLMLSKATVAILAVKTGVATGYLRDTVGCPDSQPSQCLSCYK